MNNDSPQKALLVVFLVALVCSVLVSIASVILKPIQQQNRLIERARNIIALTGLIEDEVALSGDSILEALDRLDIRVLNIDAGDFAGDIDATEFDSGAAAKDPERSIAIPDTLDIASLGRRSSYEVIYLVWNGDRLNRVILPVVGQGMWSTLRGYLALEGDLNTIAAVSFYEQAETAGLGDQIQRPEWQAQWRGRKLFDEQGNLRFRVGGGSASTSAPEDAYRVDSLSGATVTSDAVTRLIAYWFGPNGYKPFLDNLNSRRTTVPSKETGGADS